MFKKLSCYICAFKEESLHHSFLIVSLTIAHHLLRSKTIKAYSFPSRNKNTGTCFLRIIFWLFCPVQFIYCSLSKPNPDVKHCCYIYCIFLYTCVLGVICVPEIYAVDEGSSLAALILCGQFRRNNAFFVSIYFPMYLVIRPPIFFWVFPEFNLVIFFSKSHVFDAGNLFWVHKLLHSYLL